MENKIINKEIILRAIEKSMANQEIVRTYIKGKITAETLAKKGIKLAKPI